MSSSFFVIKAESAKVIPDKLDLQYIANVLETYASSIQVMHPSVAADVREQITVIRGLLK